MYSSRTILTRVIAAGLVSTCVAASAWAQPVIPVNFSIDEASPSEKPSEVLGPGPVVVAPASSLGLAGIADNLDALSAGFINPDILFFSVDRVTEGVAGTHVGAFALPEVANAHGSIYMSCFSQPPWNVVAVNEQELGFVSGFFGDHVDGLITQPPPPLNETFYFSVDRNSDLVVNGLAAPGDILCVGPDCDGPTIGIGPAKIWAFVSSIGLDVDDDIDALMVSNSIDICKATFNPCCPECLPCDDCTTEALDPGFDVVQFSLDPFSPSTSTFPGGGPFSPAGILITDFTGPPTTFMSHSELGLLPDDDVTAIWTHVDSGDCNNNGPDAFEICFGVPDCQPDGIPDECQVPPDCDGNGVPDECEEEPCCLPNGACVMKPPVCCANDGGTPVPACLGDLNGNGTDDACDEACCLGDNSCVQATAPDCSAQGGVAQGVGSECAASEACCFSDGTCQDLDPSCCADSGGTTQGPFSMCEGDGNGNDIDDACELCGNGQPDPGEECDDGNNVDGDGCQSNCLLPVCGDSILDLGEECDGGGGDTAACDGDCTVAMCGDAYVNTTAGEQCDDGNTVNGDGCQWSCQLPSCGDFSCDQGEDPCNCAADCGPPAASEIPGSTCDDGKDNDCDWAADCADSDCTSDPGCSAVCGDGACGFLEDSCGCPGDCGAPPSSETPGSTCLDGLDNDCDGDTDCADPDCASYPACLSCPDGTCGPGEDNCTCPADCPGSETPEMTCNDGLDNDCDGCTDSPDSDCGGTETSCSDGNDNDCDTFTDCNDLPDCAGDPACIFCGNGVCDPGEDSCNCVQDCPGSCCGDCLPADFNGDGVVGPFDLATLLAAWGPCTDCDECPPDLNGDCTVGPTDLAMLLANWG